MRPNEEVPIKEVPIAKRSFVFAYSIFFFIFYDVYNAKKNEIITKIYKIKPLRFYDCKLKNLYKKTLILIKLFSKTI